VIAAPPSAVATPPFRRRRGYTLLELMLALGLSVLLLGAAYTAFDLQRRYVTAGEDQILRSQLARGVVQQFRTDVQSVVGVPDVAAEDVSSQRMWGLSGDARRCLLRCSRLPGDDFQLAWSASSELSQGDESYVVWLVVDEPLAAAARRNASREPGGEPVVGLARRQIAPLAMLDGTAVEIARGMRAADVIAPEIRRLSFRYFDGEIWVDQWDARARGRLPAAVELTFGFHEPNADRRGEDSDSEAIRAIVALPIADPFATGVQP